MTETFIPSVYYGDDGGAGVRDGRPLDSGVARGSCGGQPGVPAGLSVRLDSHRRSGRSLSYCVIGIAVYDPRWCEPLIPGASVARFCFGAPAGIWRGRWATAGVTVPIARRSVERPGVLREARGALRKRVQDEQFGSPWPASSGSNVSIGSRRVRPSAGGAPASIQPIHRRRLPSLSA